MDCTDGTMRREVEKSEWEDRDEQDSVKSGAEDADEMSTQMIPHT